MITAAISVDFRSAAKLADRHDQCFVQKPSLIEVFDQSREANVEHRAQDIFDAIGVLGMSIPEWVVGSVVTGFARPVNMHKPNTGLDQPPGQEDALPPAISTVAIADDLWFLSDVEGLASLS